MKIFGRPFFERLSLPCLAAASLIALLAWDDSSLDLAMARWFGDTHGFALRNNWWLAQAFHDDVKLLPWIFTLALVAGVIWPIGPWTRLSFKRRLQLPVSAMLATAIVTVLKQWSGTSCPWDLSDFGGVAHHMSHWSGWLGPDGGGGHCFPAGHATAGFAFLGGYFALRAELPRAARAWLGVALGTGFTLGFLQQMRGAHFMSHTLWTAWICWIVAWLTDLGFARSLEIQMSGVAP